MRSKLNRTSLLAAAFAAVAFQASASPTLVATGSLSSGGSDLSGLTGSLESGASASLLGGIGSGLAWAGGNTFLALPDRGPNATAWNAALDNTTSYISRFHTLTLSLSAPATLPSSGAGLGSLTPTLAGTTLLYSSTALDYAAASPTNNGIAGTPSINSAGHFYFSGRSDNYLTGSTSVNPSGGRFDPEAIRLSNDGAKVYVTDEYGPYVYQFDRATGARTGTYTLPSAFTAANLSPVGATEISGNTTGRVANKGMEGLAITPDGKYLVGFEQSPLIQDGGDGGKANRLVKIDVETGATQQFVYNNYLADKNKTYNSSEILALNDHEFLVLERDGKGLGDGTSAVLKRIYKIDLNGATDIGTLNGGAGISGESNLLSFAVNKSLFLDIRLELNAKGFADTDIPAKLEGMAFGSDIDIGGTSYHTLYIGNDNDFLPSAGNNQWYVFAFTDADLAGSVFQNQSIVAAVPEPSTCAAFAGAGVLALAALRRRRVMR